jgi:hypothetical protein
VLAAFGVAAVGLIAFALWERRSPHPMLPVELFRDRRMSVGSGVITSAFFVMFGLFFLFTLYLQFVRAYSPLSAGLATLPLALTLVAVAPRSAVVAERVGAGPVMAAGFVLTAAGFAVFGFVGPHASYLLLAVGLVLLGAGISLTAAPATASIMSAVPDHKAGVGSAVNDTTREVGGALGIAILGSIASALYRSAIDLKSVPLPPGAAKAAKESLGAASVLASQVPNGADLAAKAGSAFTHALNVTSLVAAVLSVGAAGVVAAVFSHRTEREAAEAFAAANAAPSGIDAAVLDEIPLAAAIE